MSSPVPRPIARPRRLRVRAGESDGAGPGIDVLQDTAELLGPDLTLRAGPSRPRADPLPGGLPGAGVVLLGAAGDVVDVVLLLARGQLPQAQHVMKSSS